MTAEIISVGTELLLGQIVNTDAQYLARELSAFGIGLYRQTTVGDNMGRLVDAICSAYEKNDIVILSGGLGPTEDDLTKLGVAQFLGLPMVVDEPSKKALEERFVSFHRVMTPNNLRQVEFPQGSIILPNSCGTAPGCICERDGKAIITLPGPPHELKAMFESGVAPYLSAQSNTVLVSRVIRVFGIGESAAEHMIKDMIDAQTNPTIAPYAGMVEMNLRVTASCKPNEDPMGLITPVIDEIKKRLGEKAVYSTNDEPLGQVVANFLREQGKTISIAESLTGGMLADSLVEFPGISANFLEGIVAYSNAAKERLGVSREILSQHTAVSEQTAKEMARCIRLRSGTDIGVSTTGVAGPGPDEFGHEAGMFYVGISTQQGEYALHCQSSWHRQRTRMYATLFALNELRLLLSGLQK